MTSRGYRGWERSWPTSRTAGAFFFTHGSDHHAFVLFPRNVMDAFVAAGGGGGGKGEVTINQITWQTGALAEVVDGAHFFEEQGIGIQRVGRDMPGSNWHVYPYDPDGHINELYYGIEQIDWTRRSKPRDMYYRIFHEEPALPQMSEEAEIEEAVAKGIDVFSGFRGVNQLPANYDVEGVMLPRPFKITKIGPVNLFVQDMEASLNFYMNHLGFVLTEETEYNGHRLYFLRNGSEHHSLALFPKHLREELGCSFPHHQRLLWRRGRQLQPVAERRRVLEGAWCGVQGDAAGTAPGH